MQIVIADRAGLYSFKAFSLYFPPTLAVGQA